LVIDRDKLSSQLTLLDKYSSRLQGKKNMSQDRFLADPDLQAVVERNFQLAIECCLNIGTHLIAGIPLDPAEDYGSVFVRLAEAGILPKDFGEKLTEMARFRNLLVHVYWKIDPTKVYARLQENLDDFKIFAQHIVKFLETQK